jgi:hypothetical protein
MTIEDMFSPKWGEPKIIPWLNLARAEQLLISTEYRIMLKKILLAFSSIALAIGFSNVGEASQWGVGLPLGAVFFILFFIVTLLEKEAALYDAEQLQKSANLSRFSATPLAIEHHFLASGRISPPQ